MKYKVISDLPCREMVPGITMREVHLEKVMVTFVELEEGAVIPPHSHEHEQISLIISGSLFFNVDGEERLVKPGEVVVIPSGVEHSVSAVSGPAVAYDCFSPVRKDYVKALGS
ncbi:MAG: cupin domain-containing protein [bacterium]